MAAAAQKEDCLINFRINNEMKEVFDSICRFNRTNRSHQITNLMRRFIDEMTPQIISHHKNEMAIIEHLNPQQTQPKSKAKKDDLERWGNLIKHPITKVWVPIDEYEK